MEELDLVRDALTPGPVHILGHSWGTTLAMEWLISKRPAEIGSVIFASPCLSTPRWMKTRVHWSPNWRREAQAALPKRSELAISIHLAFKGPHGASGCKGHIVRQLPAEAIESLLGSLAEMNANLELLEYMWGPSDFTVTGSLKNYDRTCDLGTLRMPVLFHCGEFDEALTDYRKAAGRPHSERRGSDHSWRGPPDNDRRS